MRAGSPDVQAVPHELPDALDRQYGVDNVISPELQCPAMKNEKIGVFTDDTLIKMVDGSVRKFGDIRVEGRFREVMTSSGPAKVIAETETPPKI